MNSRERVLTALIRKGPPDKTPFEISWGAFTPLLMKTFLFTLSFLLCNCLSTNNQQSNAGIDFTWLKENFQNPPSEYGLNCWWWWLNSNVTKEAIKSDLEAMKSRNFQGAVVYDGGGHNQRGNRDVPSGPQFGSDEWNELFIFTLDEAKRLGLEIGLNIQSGWNLGGPMITPQYAAKQLTYAETKITGGTVISQKLDTPVRVMDFYKDIAVLAIPLNERNKTNESISDLDLKLAYHELGGSATDTRFLLNNVSRTNTKKEDKTTYIIKSDEILNLTSKMDGEGNLNWEAPEGEWSILRLGYTCSGALVSTSSDNWGGLILDYLSKEAFNFYWMEVLDPIFKAAGDHTGTTLKDLGTDSWECEGMNWTDRFEEEFSHYRGYDVLDYLPVVAGYVVGDIETSNAFLSDFRKTLGDLVANNHYALFAENAHKYNMRINPESAGPHAGSFDGMKNFGFSDIVMGEFWAPSPHRPLPENRFFLKQASSAAHIYGKKIVGAESFTTIGPHWNDELWHDQKSAFDHEICAGLNRVYLTTFTCSPAEMGLPGQEFFACTHINPRVTWWEQSGPFIDYIHRIQMVMQEGKFVADVLYYYGDHVPNVFPFKHSDPAGTMPGFDYDVTDETIFLQLKVEDGKIVVPGGVKYRVLVLPDHKVLSLAVLEKTDELLKEGATVLGHKPVKMVSLAGGPKAQRTFGDLTDKIWGDETTEKGEKRYGNGTIAWGMTSREYLLTKDVPADFDILGNDSKTDFDYIHYTIGENDLFFVSNQTTEKQEIKVRFRVSGKQPELWDALTGTIREAKAYSQNDGLTTVPLTLEPYGAVIVVFSNKIAENEQGTSLRNYADYETMAEITGEWTVNFDPEWGGPGTVTFPELLDWTKHSDDGIKYYSGTAVYSKTFRVDFEPQKGQQYYLKLGSVKDVGIAGVKLNGKETGVVWTPPFRVAISEDLKKGENKLEIRLVNSWYNRVAGDQTWPDRKQYTSTNIVLKNDFRGRPIAEIPLEPSGLLGPVTVEEAAMN
jgi:hypothetical protein